MNSTFDKLSMPIEKNQSTDENEWMVTSTELIGQEILGTRKSPKKYQPEKVNFFEF